ncbi:lipoxygenase [Leptolyngbya sp. FACHB-671]|uniref:lipoxygenase family protein n=1 Tax=Leptolyngbya sp. FACHB-671 TaxID=2692812 RepID=UPI001682BACE|nr:lipoxygenase family protein [Leptolyngbya sp. FACHB-671]MBD2067395.1 lipoxygenase [Leptolyngbya sp. FACHB-671]
MLHLPPEQQQGFYRYSPVGLKQRGPARLFAHIGEDGALGYGLTRIYQNLIEQGRVSPPLNLLMQWLESTVQKTGQQVDRLSTLLADVEFLHSDWLNWTLPPGETFNSNYVRKRLEMGQALKAASKAAIADRLQDASPSKDAGPGSERQRLRFYTELEQRWQRERPKVSFIHARDGELSDREFARQRLAGTNPMILHRIQEADRERLQAWATQDYSVATEKNVNLLDAAAQNRLFLADYPLFEDLTSTDLQLGRYVGNPQALFYGTEQGLYPVLIQLESGSKWVTPTAVADDWMRAKLYTQAADMTHHELIDHLCNTHLSMEAFAIATSRQLPVGHPLYQLLRPHFRFLLAINTRGNTLLLAEDAAIEDLLAPTREASVSLINQSYRQRSFTDGALPYDIARRGLEPEFLPDFAYRDDAQLLWDAIATYVSSYLQRYYRDDTAVLLDPYLQAWAAELGQPLSDRPLSEFPELPDWIPAEFAAKTGIQVDTLPDYPRVPNFPAATSANQRPGEIQGLQQLIEIATQIIFTCGPQHAAVNFSQFDYAGYMPNAPLATYARPDAAVKLEEVLPPVDQDLNQMELTFALSGIIWGQLGDSKLIQYEEEGDRQILHQFQLKLKSIEQEIQQRNQQRINRDGVDYPYLLPSRIPNSINI